MEQKVSIKAILNYVPAPILHEIGEVEVLKWAMQGFGAYCSGHTTPYSYRFILKKYDNHTTTLDTVDIKRIHAVTYYASDPYTKSNDPLNTSLVSETATEKVIRRYNFAADSDDVLMLQQQTMFDMEEYFSTGTLLQYVGQHPELIECRPDISICSGWYLTDYQLNWIKVSEKKGWLGIMYKTLAQDNDGELIVPNDNILLKALALYAEARYLQGKSLTSAALYNRYLNTDLQAQKALNEAFTDEMLRNYSPRVYYDLVFNRFPLGKLNIVSGNNRNSKYYV